MRKNKQTWSVKTLVFLALLVAIQLVLSRDREVLMRDIRSWRQAPCANSMEPITSSTVP